MTMKILFAVLVVGCSTGNQDNKLETLNFETNEEIPTSFQDNEEDTGIVLKDGVEISRYSGHKNKLEYEELFNSLS